MPILTSFPPSAVPKIPQIQVPQRPVTPMGTPKIPKVIQNFGASVANTFKNTVGERIGAVAQSIKTKSFTPLKQSFQAQGQELKQQFGGPSGAINAALSFGGVSEYKNLSPADLISHEGAPDAARIAQFRQQIRSGQQLEPIKVIREGNKFGIEDGKHRFAAYQAEGVKNIPVEIIKQPVKVNNYQAVKQFTKDGAGKFTGSIKR